MVTVAIERYERLHDLVRRADIEIAGRLVREQHARRIDERGAWPTTATQAYESRRRPDWVAMPVFGAHLVCLVLLPNDAQGGSVDAEADIISLTVYGHVAN
jgi:hypothetical protein